MTFKSFCLFQCIWLPSRVTKPWCIANWSHWNQCIWSLDPKEHHRISDFFFKQKIVLSGLLWPYTLILVAPIGKTAWLCDPRWESYALEQAERLLSQAKAKKVVHIFALNPLYLQTQLIVFSIFSLLMVSYLWYYTGLHYSAQGFTVVKLVLTSQTMTRRSEDSTCMFLVSKDWIWLCL